MGTGKRRSNEVQSARRAPTAIPSPEVSDTQAVVARAAARARTLERGNVELRSAVDRLTHALAESNAARDEADKRAAHLAERVALLEGQLELAEGECHKRVREVEARLDAIAAELGGERSRADDAERLSTSLRAQLLSLRDDQMRMFDLEEQELMDLRACPRCFGPTAAHPRPPRVLEDGHG